jgi:hypothetical protein
MKIYLSNFLIIFIFNYLYLILFNYLFFKSVKIPEKNEELIYLIGKNEFSLFDISRNKIIENLNYSEINKSFNEVKKEANKNNNQPMKISSDISKIDSNQVRKNKAY